MSLAQNMPCSSSKVSTKSTSERTLRRDASSFLAAQGPIKTMRASGLSFLTRRAVSTMGVRAMEMLSLNSGKRVLAITLQAGQQLVPIQSSFSGTFSIKSLASSTVHMSAPMATSTVSTKPSMRMALRSLAGVASLPNWPTNAGATQAMTLSPLRIAWMSWNIWLLSAMAENGQLTRHMPQETHLL